MPAQKKTLYDILGVPRDAMTIDVGLAYEKRLAELQRMVPQDPSALALLHEAHEVLSDAKRRAAYDAALVTAQEKALAKEQAAAPDLVLEPEADEGRRRTRIPPIGIAMGVVAALILLFFALPSRTPEAPAPSHPAEVPAPPPPPPQPKPAKDVLAQSLASVGTVQGVEMSGRAVHLGLAFAIEPGAMVTTCHGIRAGSELVVTVAGENHSATLAVTDELLDLCRLSVTPPVKAPLALAPVEAKPGDRVYVLGANAAGQLALAEGEVKAIVPDPRGPMLQLSVPVAAGDSGGAVFDPYGKVLGIATTARAHGGAAPGLGAPASWIAQMRSRERGK